MIAKTVRLLISLMGSHLMNIAWLMLDQEDRQKYISRIGTQIQRRETKLLTTALNKVRFLTIANAELIHKSRELEQQLNQREVL